MGFQSSGSDPSDPVHPRCPPGHATKTLSLNTSCAEERLGRCSAQPSAVDGLLYSINKPVKNVPDRWLVIPFPSHQIMLVNDHRDLATRWKRQI